MNVRRSWALVTAGWLVALHPIQGQEPVPATILLDSLLDARVSTAAKYEQTVRAAASGVTIVTSEEIDRYGYRTLADVLQSLRGFYLSNDRNYTYLGARGFSRPTDYNNRVVVLIDGHVINEPLWGSALLGGESGVDLATLERIEVVRGPGSALYGTGAMFGVINLVTRSGAAREGVELVAQSGSYGQRGGKLLAGRELGGLDVAVAGFWDGVDGHDLYYQEFDAPETNNGVAHDADWERRWGVHGRVSRGGLMLHGRYSAREKGVPTGAYGTTFDGDARSRDAYGFGELRYETLLDAARRLTVRGYGDLYAYDAVYPEPTGAIWRAEGRTGMVGTEATLGWDVTSGHRVVVGAELRRVLRARYVLANGTAAEGMDVPHTIASVYVHDDLDLGGGVSLVAGVRHDHYSTTGGATAPRGGLVYSPGAATALKLVYGRAFRAPSPSEAYNDAGPFIQNPDLEPERMHMLEAIWQQRLGRGLAATVSAFTYDVHGLIDLTEHADGALHYHNRADARVNGVELGLDARIDGVMGYANYTHQQARVHGTDEPLSNSPDHLVKAGLSVPLGAGVVTGAEARYESSRLTVYGSRTDPFALAHLHLGYMPRLASDGAPRGLLDRLELSLRINNLFDAEYATPGGVEHVQPAIAQDGRHLSAELRVRF